MLFKNRREAGERLARKLEGYRGTAPLILAVPRGGVAVAMPLWESLGGELDLSITRKIGAPGQPELALGAVTGEGLVMLNRELVAQLRVPQNYIDRVAAEEREEIRRRLQLYRGGRPRPCPEGRTVILVDDGVATGYTLLAALRGLRQKKPGRLILAVPVGPPDTVVRLSGEVDESHCLATPPYFAAVGQFYRDFQQVPDEEVISLLARAWAGEG